MLTRRQLVTGGAVGALTATASATTNSSFPDDARQTRTTTAGQDADTVLLTRIQDRLGTIDDSVGGLAAAFKTNSLSFGFVPKLREAYTQYWRANGKFPDSCEVGSDVFYDLYDWHVKNGQPIPVSRLADGRMSITFMYTQLIVRVDQVPNFIGVPFDRT
ncbi:MAG: hypothetical protein HQ485_10080 [Acidobacteria bacterium]|jgi:hypothetical protein|nr:hypothetical protein [Acidobacteriota bacterium]